MKKFILCACLAVVYGAACAIGGSYVIRGTVADSLTGKGTELATISLLQPGTGKIISVATSNADGKFAIDKVSAGNYELAVSLLGYNTTKMPVEVKEDKEVGTISLASGSKTLGEAVVTSEKALITKTSEKTVYNVAQSPLNQTGTAEDVLRNMPGVSVDQKGNIAVVGKDGVKVLVDGKPDAMAEANLQNFLKSIPANSIEAIELITNPSAKYDAEGNAGVINIKLKKGKAEGLNGSISAGYGYPNRYDGNLSVNYKKKKVNLFGVYSADATTTGNRYIEDRKITIDDTTTNYHMDSKGKEKHIINSLKLGADYLINDKNTLTYTFGGSYTNLGWSSDATSRSADSMDNTLKQYQSGNEDKAGFASISNGVNYQRKFDSTERELTVLANYTYLFGGGRSSLNSQAYNNLGIYDEAGSLLQRTESGMAIHNFIAQLDYVQPLKWKGYKIETGLKNEATWNKNTFDVFRTVNNSETKDSLLSNAFNYTENIAAAYIIFDGAYKKILTYSAGLRAEHTYMNSNDNAVDRRYISWFPSGSVNFTFNERNSLSGSYSRRVQRPQFKQINNTVIYIDQYSTWQGNPYIQPSFSHIVSLNYTLMVKQHMFSLEAAGTFQTAGFIESTRIDSNRISRGGYLNGADSRVFSLTFFSKLKLTRWWEFQANQTYMYSDYSFQPGINTKTFAGSAYSLWASTNFKFWKNTVLEIGGWFNTGGVHSQGDAWPVGSINTSIKKSFLHDHLTVSLSGHNLLNSMKWKWTVYNSGLETLGSWQNNDRNVAINLTYRFGSGKPINHHLNDENERLNGVGQGR